jgi:hypothetical protein
MVIVVAGGAPNKVAIEPVGAAIRIWRTTQEQPAVSEATHLINDHGDQLPTQSLALVVGSQNRCKLSH